MSTSEIDVSTGKIGFIERHELWSDEQKEAAKRIESEVREKGLRQVRISWADQHGIARGKTLTVDGFSAALRNGKDFQSAVLIMDTTNNIIVPLFVPGGGFGIPEMTGYPDTILVPDPTTFRVLPWAQRTGWVLADMHFANGKPVPFSTREILRNQVENLRKTGYDYVAGLEVEFYITKLEDPKLTPEQSGWPPEPPSVSTIAHGFQYLTENRNAEIDPILQLLTENLEAIGLPVRSIEDEWGPGQTEFTFAPVTGVEAADNMILFRTATKQICRQHGYHATFMSRPALPNFFSSGWHLHQSLYRTGSSENVFVVEDDSSGPVSEIGRHFAGGLLAHAAAASVFTTPTINGYKRFQPNSFAPSRICWAYENRGAFVRVIGGPGDVTTHLENRAGEPTANPYLYMASQIASGMHGVENQTEPPPLSEEPYSETHPPLPGSLTEAVARLKDSALFREQFGDAFVDYILMVKQSEIGRFNSYVTDWEHREYFEVF
jgi:glutamine synthetase